MLSRSFKFPLVFGWVIFLSILLRIYQIQIPIAESFNSLTRQSISASVVRNFYQNGYRFLNPEINENGKGPYLFHGEMPIYSFLMALVYGLLGGAHEWGARFVSVIFSIGTIVIIGLISRKLFDQWTALIAMIILSFSPLNLALSRAIQPESLMLFSSCAAIYTMMMYLEKSKSRYFFLSLLMMFVAIATKFYNFYIFAPIYFLILQKNGLKMLKNPRFYLYFFGASLAFVWYFCMIQREKAGDLAYVVYQFVQTRGPSNQTFIQLLFSPSRLFFINKIFIFHLLTPVGFVLFLFGFVSLFKKNQANYFLGAWLLTAFALMLVFWRTVIDHAYYQLPLILPCAIVAGRGGVWLWNKWLSRVPKKALLATLIAALAIEIVSVGYYYPKIYFLNDQMKRVVSAGKAVDIATPKNALVVAYFGNSPIQLYFCNRKGWTFSIDDKSDHELIESLKSLVNQGAEYFVSTFTDELRLKREFLDYLMGEYQPVEINTDYLIVHLTPKNKGI